MSEAIVIAVDGPAGAGKGELTRRLAEVLDFDLLDSGAIYRVLGYAVRKAGLALFDEDSVVQEAKLLNLSFECMDDGVHVLLNGEDVSKDIRTEEAGNNASKVAAYPSVRQALLQRQREFLKEPGLVADGRDMGTVVFPKAQVKIFLDASAEVRANRRVLQLQSKGKSCDFDSVLQEIDQDLLECAGIGAMLDAKMEKIQEKTLTGTAPIHTGTASLSVSPSKSEL